MHKVIISAAVAALLGASALPAISQDAGISVDASAGAGVNVQSPDATAGSTVNAGASITTDAPSNTYGVVASSVAGSASVDLSGITDEASVSIVLLSSLEGDATTDGALLDDAMTASAESMAAFHAKIEGNAAIKAKLEAEGHSADDVVAVTSNADGTLTVYVDDRA